MASKDSSIANFLDFHTHQVPSRSAEYDFIYAYNPTFNELPPQNTIFSCGLHPWSLKKINISNKLDSIRRMSTDPNCIAIGEAGIDRAIPFNFSEQVKVFEDHIKLSEELSKPLVIHCVRAYEELIRLHKEYKPIQPWIIHDFNANEQILNEILKYQMYVSIGPRILQANSRIKSILKSIPLENIFFETDDNPEQEISEVYSRFSKERNIDMQILVKRVQQNFKHLFARSI